MAKEIKETFIAELSKRFGSVRKMERSKSLYEIGEGAARIYIRYSKVHSRKETFYGLRYEDLKLLEGYTSYLCFLWEGQIDPLIVPFSEYEEVFGSISPAADGQYKVMIYLEEGTELYIAGTGRFNVDMYYGWNALEDQISSTKREPLPTLSHPQIQTLLGAIGTAKGYDIWIPSSDRPKLEWSMTDRFECRDTLPYGFDSVMDILQEVDTIWIERGSSKLRGCLKSGRIIAWQSENSTPVI